MRGLTILALSLFTLNAHAVDESLLRPYFGSYRVLAYNGETNSFSKRYFTPSVNTEPSVKLGQENGEVFRTLNFNFEVPARQFDGSLSLKFIFPEMPLQGAVIKEISAGLELSFDGNISERSAEHWNLCAASYRVKLTRQDAQYVKFEFKKEADFPCTSESHAIDALLVPAP